MEITNEIKCLSKALVPHISAIAILLDLLNSSLAQTLFGMILAIGMVQ